ncbi:MAG: hypothetical protein K6T63_10350 [Alicyclobacillus herbarius]|uniref:hypothetical protein n=1 Tax=Alicyclobacillus herbarius TaxID=122960 RepID=UPI002356768E|nr:hypothetical protein [Alicyclobacillus herbarius]MCL6633020.1 hypothetical protein [Alicyclobacillus herbarius]
MDVRLNICRRQVDRWIDDFGEAVFAACCESDGEPVERFIEVYQDAFLALYRGRDRQLTAAPRAWLIRRAEDGTRPKGDARQDKAEKPSEMAYEALLCQTKKRVRAIAIAEWARQQQQGPRWTRYALGLTGLFGLLAVAAAEFSSVWLHPVHAAAGNSDKARALPPVLANLPTATHAQFAVEGQQVSLDHAAANDNALFLPRLQTTDAKGTREIDVYGYRFRDSGRPLDGAQNLFGRIRLLPPGGKSVAESAWKVDAWSFQPAGTRWAIATVEWQPRDTESGPDGSVVQLYALSLENGESALVKSLTTGGSGADEYIIASGAGRVVVEGEVGSADTGTADTSVALPVQVYNLVGAHPQHALVLWKELAALHHPLYRPVVTRTGIISQATDTSSAGETSWNLLNWNGQVSDLAGPPADGQPHWALEGEDGRLWWVETTPDAHQGDKRLQVLMGSLNSTSNVDQSPALTLDGSVLDFQVSGDNLIWLQDVGNIRQLVVAEVK